MVISALSLKEIPQSILSLHQPQLGSPLKSHFASDYQHSVDRIHHILKANNSSSLGKN